MEQTINKLDRIINKIGLILEDNLKLKEEVNHLNKKITEFKNNRDQLESKYEQVNKEMQRMKLMKSVEITNEDKILMKKELKNYIKEIDKCMELLNK